MRSFYTVALCLALIQSSSARVPHSFRDLIDREPEPQPKTQNGIIHWISRLFKRIAQSSSTSPSNSTSTGGTCYEDAYYEFVDHLQTSFCQQYMNTPNVTATVDYTPSTTVTDLFTTYVSTAEELSRVTPLSTLTVTTTPQSSPALPQITARGVAHMDVNEVFQKFRRQNSANASTIDDNALSTSFSSACSCHDYPGSTVTATYTDEPVTGTLSEFTRTTTTSTRTTFAAVRVVSTTTLTAQPTSSTSTDTSSESSTSGSAGVPAGSSSTTSSSGGPGGSATATSSNGEPTPTSPPYTCPDDNNTTVSQLVGNERFDYLVLCDTALMDDDLYSGSLNYPTFGQCVSACSIANANFSFPVCQGVSYLATGSSSGNCFLKSSANFTTVADGVDSALLQRIAIGITNASTSGTTTEAAPFADQTMTQNAQEMSSIMQSILSNSTENMPMVTPFPLVVQSGMLVNAGPGAVYSTFVTGGSTFSSGTAYSFSTMYNDGSWYMTYFSSYTLAWTTATTVYEATATGSSVYNSTNSQNQQYNNEDGGYTTITTTNYTTYTPNGYNVTEVQQIEGFAANGTMTTSTAITSIWSVETGGAVSGAASGSPASGSAITSTSVFSTQTVIVNSGGASGVESTQASGGPTPAPTISATTIVNTFGSAGSTGFAASGGGSGIGSAVSGAASGAPSSSIFTPVSVIVSSGGTGGVKSGGGSGGPTGTGGMIGTAASAGPSSLTPTPVSVILNSSGTGGVISSAASGGPTGTGGVTGTEASGGPSSSPSTGTFTNSPILRSGTYSTTSSTTESPLRTAPLSETTSIPMINSTTGVYTPPIGTGSTDTFTNSPGLRTGGLSSSTPSGTAPSSPSGPLSNGPSPYPSANSTAPSGTSPSGTAPSGTAPTGTAPLGTAPAPPHQHGPPIFNTAPSSSSTGTFTNNQNSRNGLYSTTSSGTAPSGSLPSGYTPPGTAPPGTGTVPPLSSPSTDTFTNSPGSRVGGFSTAPSDTAPPGTAPPGTAPTNGTSTHPHPWPTAPISTCSNMTVGTTTIFSTTTVYGCYSQCLPNTAGWSGYGAPPLAFGPPGFANPTGVRHHRLQAHEKQE